MSNLQQERLLLVLAPVAGNVVKQDETAVYLARIQTVANDGGIVRYANMDYGGITRCVREIIPQHTRVTTLAGRGQLQFGQQPIPARILFTAEDNDRWDDQRAGFDVGVTEND